MSKGPAVLLRLEAEIDKRNWELYAVHYDSDGMTFLGYIYAISEEHAQLVIEDMKESLTLIGKFKDHIVIRPEDGDEDE